jgi:hypothetical protein
MDRNQVRFAFLKIVFVVLALTSWVFWGFIYTTRPEEAAAEIDALGALIRLPASLPKQLAPSTKVLQPIRMDTFRVPCWDVKDGDNRATDARWVRLIGRPCQEQKLGAVQVRNLSNGYMATVFDPQRGDLTTDFIPLQLGENTIQIRFEGEPGVALESQFAITRHE